MSFCHVFLLTFMSIETVTAQRQAFAAVPSLLSPTVIQSHSADESVCPVERTRQAAFDEISNAVRNILRLSVPQVIPECGSGTWYPVGFLNMSDPTHQCPTTWKLYNENGIRSCGRSDNPGASCASTFYPPGREYNRVCGRVIGYQISSPAAFYIIFTTTPRGLDDIYVDGVSITYGSPRSHIWTYAAGHSEEVSTVDPKVDCPCSHDGGSPAPSYIGDNYYCESGRPTDAFTPNVFFGNDPLWDGQQCASEGTCCTDKSPPWFTVDLSNPTTDDVEVRICGDEGTDNEDTPIALMEIFVQ